MTELARPLAELCSADERSFGGKSASLGELLAAGIPVPPGFAVPASAMGSLDDGIDTSRQADWLATRHVHRQEPCRSCWARYLCGGGCHHEVIGRGRPACDYIRGWLHYCLEAYLRLSAEPEMAGRDFAGMAAEAGPGIGSGTGHG